MMIPRRIGKYEIRGQLGEGATSIVYLGFDPFTEREVAVKVFFPEILRDKERGRLYQHLLLTEASLAGKLLHPHIVQIHDAVVAEEQSYIVMEYVRGGTLEPFCSPGTLLPVDRLVEIIFKCTRALEYAFRAGVTHRDIKPANILLVNAGDSAERASGDIKISDFGAAMMTSADQTRTMVSGVGSPAYMSPQQVRDMSINHQTDIYSLGVVMYQLLTGRLPFQSNSNYGMIYQICNVDPPPPSSFRAELPASLDAVVARAMQRELDARYQTWEEFSHDLARGFRSKRLSEQRLAFPDSEKFEALRALHFFSEFSDVEVWEVVRFSTWEEVAAGTPVMRDGARGDSFAFLLDGELTVAKNGHALGSLAAGECFGEMAVLRRGKHTRTADVSAGSNTRVVSISAQSLQNASDVCRMHFYQGFLDVIAGRLADANMRLTSL
jgi:serine/threonine protein kinase